MPDWILHALLFAVGVALLIAGGDALVRGSVTIAARLRVAPLIIGLTVVAFGTSAPELALNIAAALSGSSGLSFGNVVGSNIANIGLILGLCAVVKPMIVNAQLVRREMPIMIAATAALIALLALPPDAEPGRRGIARLDGAILLAGFALFTWSMIRAARRSEGKPDEFIDDATAVTVEGRTRSMRLGWLLTIAGLALLVGGGKLAEVGATGIARALGFSDQLIGLTVVAVATSLPELAASLMAVRKGHTDLAVGNVVGSNIFNILLVMGATGAVRPVPLPEGSLFSLLAMALLSVLLIPMSQTANRHISRFEGLVLLSIYAGTIAWSIRAALA
ncbi:MAG: calcium/sodium antiporter [Phycisphaeraceae bacterium]|nr:calcium/sodium antiporter [Phycisphaeraceae bacterium]MCB9847003.1 calcium/sodium antiporter [Phycisphaeraceae bacterium]